MGTVAVDNWVASKTGGLEPVGYHDLGGRPGFKLALRVVGARWYLIVAHLWHPGWSVVDVTDPDLPELCRYVPGPPNTWTLQVTVQDDLLATSMEPIEHGWGGDATKAFDEGIQLWDITSPEAPVARGVFRTGNRGTHRNMLDSHGYLHAAARMPGYDGAIYVIVDVKDPDNPHEVGRFAIEGQQRENGSARHAWRELHGPAFRQGNIAYLPYESAGLIIVDIEDVTHPTMLGKLDVHPPLGSGIAAHTAVPLPGRDLLLLNSEALAERCQEPVGFAGVVDIRRPEQPSLISLFPQPQPADDAGYGSYCEKGGRFGPHNQHMPTGDPNLFHSDELCFLTYFNAGLRVFDTSNPYNVREVASIVPRDPSQRIGTLPHDLVTQVEDVLVDKRGFAYFTEKNSGLYVTQWNGGARS